MSSRAATTTARRGSSRSVALSSTTARAGVNTLNRVTGPRLTNTVRSSQIHDLEIEKMHKGELKNAAQKGFLAKVLDFIIAF